MGELYTTFAGLSYWSGSSKDVDSNVQIFTPLSLVVKIDYLNMQNLVSITYWLSRKFTPAQTIILLPLLTGKPIYTHLLSTNTISTNHNTPAHNC